MAVNLCQIIWAITSGSGALVIGGADPQADTFINREEYTPYGETSFGSFGRKRFRFSAKETRRESGLNFYGARYYSLRFVDG